LIKFDGQINSSIRPLISVDWIAGSYQEVANLKVRLTLLTTLNYVHRE